MLLLALWALVCLLPLSTNGPMKIVSKTFSNNLIIIDWNILDWICLVLDKIVLKKLLDWETNEHLIRKLDKYLLPEIHLHTIQLNDNFTAKVLLQLPPNMDRSGNKKYPMLVDVYGGPDSYSVLFLFIIYFYRK